jgi:formamidopyrimidine-DNA glycosylase
MTKGRHITKKSENDPTYSKEWSGVTYAPQARGKKCVKCGGHVHKEGGSYYCPYCDDYVGVV